MRNRGLAATVVILLGVIVTLLVVLFVVKLPSFLSIQEITSILGDQRKTETTVRKKDKEETVKYEPDPTYVIETYNGYNGHVIIEYPHISGLSDKEGEDKVNYRIMMNALSIVPLYPISTAVQNLEIKCNVKEFNKNCIVICYSGSVKGKDVKTVTETIKTTREEDPYLGGGGGGNAGRSSGNDPYLNGFVDPLGGGGVITSQTQSRIAATTQQTTKSSGTSFSLPKPLPTAQEITQTSSAIKSDSSSSMVPSYTTPTSSGSVEVYSAPFSSQGTSGGTAIGSTTINQSVGVSQPSTNYITVDQARSSLQDKSKSNTSDSGPTSTTITAPTAANSANYTNSNISSNNPSPINSGSSVNVTGGSQYPTGGSAQYNSNAPFSYTTGSSNVSQSNLPISGTSGSSFPTNNYQYNANSNLPIYSQASTNKAATVNEQIFYTNTIDLKTGRDVPLIEVADVEELAKYAQSDQAEIINVDPSKKNEVKKYIKKLSLNNLIKDLTAADFKNSELKSWPKSFSYKDGTGTICYSIKLTSKLGSYAIIKYN